MPSSPRRSRLASSRPLALALVGLGAFSFAALGCGTDASLSVQAEGGALEDEAELLRRDGGRPDACIPLEADGGFNLGKCFPSLADAGFQRPDGGLGTFPRWDGGLPSLPKRAVDMLCTLSRLDAGQRTSLGDGGHPGAGLHLPIQLSCADAGLAACGAGCTCPGGGRCVDLSHTNVCPNPMAFCL